MGKSKGIMVIGEKRSHMGGWINQSTKAKEIKLGEEKHSADKKKKVEQKKKRILRERKSCNTFSFLLAQYFEQSERQSFQCWYKELCRKR